MVKAEYHPELQRLNAAVHSAEARMESEFAAVAALLKTTRQKLRTERSLQFGIVCRVPTRRQAVLRKHAQIIRLATQVRVEALVRHVHERISHRAIMHPTLCSLKAFCLRQQRYASVLKPTVMRWRCTRLRRLSWHVRSWTWRLHTPLFCKVWPGHSLLWMCWRRLRLRLSRHPMCTAGQRWWVLLVVLVPQTLVEVPRAAQEQGQEQGRGLVVQGSGLCE